jgi:heterodisulfide reductase subunit D
VKLDSPEIKRIIKEHSLYMCLECGKCSASCPRLVAGKEYSPRLLVHKLIADPGDLLYIQNSVWECLTCGRCEEYCPSGVNFSRAILDLRAYLADTMGLMGFRAHDGAVHSWMRIMTAPDLEQNRLDWLTPELKVAEAGPVAFFTGCVPYFDMFFSNIAVDTISLSRDSIRLLNFFDIEPVVLGNERCCGHDLLWTGDVENFEKLCRLNYQEFKDNGVEQVITNCPECYQMLHDMMPGVIPGFDVEVTLLIDLLEREINKGGVSFKPLERSMTYQDPCRLGRGAGRYEEPRNLLQKIPGLKLEEMANSRHNSLCCGNSSFINCDAYSKRIQVERLNQAQDTGAETLVTACPKCLIHTSCAMRDPVKGESLAMEVRGLVSILASQIEWAQGETTRRSEGSKE